MNDTRTAESGAERIAAERQRQIDVEGYTPEHDAQHDVTQLWDAGCAYATGDERLWPWEPNGFKSTTRVRDLEKAGALFAAARDQAQRRVDEAAREIDRLLAERGGSA